MAGYVTLLSATLAKQFAVTSAVHPGSFEFEQPVRINQNRGLHCEQVSGRPCNDYGRLNALTKPDCPKHYIQDIVANFAEKVIFSEIDLRKAFYQIPVAAEDIVKPTFADSMSVTTFLY